jgi:hypothetical protein
MKTAKWLVENLKKTADDDKTAEDLIQIWSWVLIDEMKQIVIDELRGYEGSRTVIEKIEGLKHRI